MADENAQLSSRSNYNNSLRLGNRKKPWSIVFVVLSDFYSRLSGIRHTSDPLVHHGRHFGRTVYAMCNVRSLITNGLLRLGESDGDHEIMEESLTSEYVFLVNLSVPWAFIFCSVGHGRSIKYFRNCRPWYPISWTVLSNQKRHSRSSRNRWEPISYLLDDIFWSVIDPERYFRCTIGWYKKPERCCCRLDHPTRRRFTTCPLTQC
jgi:hypothetical protein